MSRSSNQFIAQTQGTQFTLYAVMKALGIPLSPEQETYQAELERHYPAVIEKVVCSKCGTELEYFSGLEFIPAYLYCPQCNDRAYDLEGNYIGKII